MFWFVILFHLINCRDIYFGTTNGSTKWLEGKQLDSVLVDSMLIFKLRWLSVWLVSGEGLWFGRDVERSFEALSQNLLTKAD